MKVRLEMSLDVDDSAELELSKLEHHIDWLLNLDEWPEVKSVYDVSAFILCE